MSAFYDGYDGITIDADSVTPEYLAEYTDGSNQWILENNN